MNPADYDVDRPVSRAVEVDRKHQAQKGEVPAGVLSMGALIRGMATCFKPGDDVPRATRKEEGER
jgi:hypothetical protein